jgi:hypothetical protein
MFFLRWISPVFVELEKQESEQSKSELWEVLSLLKEDQKKQEHRLTSRVWGIHSLHAHWVTISSA